MPSNHLPTRSSPYGAALDKLADTVRHVVDLAAGPDRVRAKAQAQADAEVILAEGRAQVQDIETRAIERIRKREIRRQQNIEAITVEAAKALPPPDRVSTEPVSEDWTTRFFEECKDVSDHEMQGLWSRLLAQEVATPQRFSPRTLSVLRDLTRQDAELFARICSFVWRLDGGEEILVVHGIDRNDPRTNMEACNHLQEMGLCHFGAAMRLDEVNERRLSYFGRTIALTSKAAVGLHVGIWQLTQAGRQLFHVCDAKPDDEYWKHIIAGWKQEGWTVGEPPSGRDKALEGVGSQGSPDN